MVEAEGICVLQLLRVELKFRMIGGEGFERHRVASLGARHLEERAALGLPVGKCGGVQLLAGLARGLHDRAAAVTGEAFRVRRRGHPAPSLMLAMAGGTGVVARDIGLVEFVSGVAGEATAVNFRHVPGGDGVQAVRLQRAGPGAECGAHPLPQVAVRGGVAGAATVAAGPRVLHLREDDAMVRRGHLPR